MSLENFSLKNLGNEIIQGIKNIGHSIIEKIERFVHLFGHKDSSEIEGQIQKTLKKTKSNEELNSSSNTSDIIEKMEYRLPNSKKTIENEKYLLLKEKSTNLYQLTEKSGEQRLYYITENLLNNDDEIKNVVIDLLNKAWNCECDETETNKVFTYLKGKNRRRLCLII